MLHKMRYCRKGMQSTDFILTIPRLIFTVVVVLTIVFLVRMFIVQEVDISDTQSKVFVKSLLYSPYAITYVDPETGRSYPGVIDLSLVKDDGLRDRIENSFRISTNRLLAANITFFVENRTQFNKRSVLYNEPMYKRWKPLSKLDVDGEGGVDTYSESYYVLFRAIDGRVIPGLMKVEVISSR